MELILATPNGREIRSMLEASIDLDIGTSNDFQIAVERADWRGDIVKYSRLYCPGTEYGGRVLWFGTDTQSGEATAGGFTWRGMLDKKIIQPAAGQDYKTVSGELNALLKELIEPEFDGIFQVPSTSTGITVTNHRFDRYCTLLEGIVKMLGSVNYRPKITYVQQEQGVPGYVEIQAVPIMDYSETVELSEDSQMYYIASEKKSGVNHLICLGEGELHERTVRHLYVQEDGSIGTTQFYFGADEIVDTYDYPGAEEEELISGGTSRLKELQSITDFQMHVDSLETDVDIGDIVGGRDYLTGIYVAKPITGKIWTYKDGIESLQYIVEGQT